MHEGAILVSRVRVFLSLLRGPACLPLLFLTIPRLLPCLVHLPLSFSPLVCAGRLAVSDALIHLIQARAHVHPRKCVEEAGLQHRWSCLVAHGCPAKSAARQIVFWCLRVFSLILASPAGAILRHGARVGWCSCFCLFVQHAPSRRWLCAHSGAGSKWSPSMCPCQFSPRPFPSFLMCPAPRRPVSAVLDDP